jgi:hypothetical protein
MKNDQTKIDALVHEMRSKLFVIMLHIELLEGSIKGGIPKDIQKKISVIKNAAESIKFSLEKLFP